MDMIKREPVPKQRELKQERAIQTRASIVEAALDLFSKRGFDGVRVRDIADRLDVNHALIYYHFPTKDVLWRESVALLFERLLNELDVAKIPTDLTAKDRFKILIRNYIQYCARHPEHARLTVQESINGSDRLKWAAETFIRVDHGRLLPLIDALMAEGSLPDADPLIMLYSLVAMCQFPYLIAAEMQFVHGIDAFAKEAIDAHIDTVTKLIFRD